uniref:Glycosyltransferase n=1 Tax=Fagopyrum tataricum TaxID=62330 RepID=A0A6B7ENS8_FAGTA|nr:UGT79J1 [Fagopyrum tataricum]
MENEKVERKEEERLHVAMFPWFAFGHINPFIHLSNKLSSHGVRISFLSASGNIPKIKYSLVQSDNTQIIPLHIPTIEGLPPGHENTSNMTDDSMPELLKLALDQMQPQIKTLLAHLKPHIVFIDFAQYWLPNLVSELNIKTVHFCVYSSIACSFNYLASMKQATTKITLPNVEDLKKPPKGHPKPSLSIKTFEAENMLYLFRSFYGGPPAIMRSYLSTNGSDAIAFKSCNEMEGPYIDYIKSCVGKPVLLTSLTLPEPPSSLLEPKFSIWLAQYPPKSVIFCSFGSESFLEDDQIKELALGLELTHLPFILVLNFLESSEPTRLDQALPSGFMERVKERGMVQTGWVQQQQILAHENVGCYVSHSGFGSILEALIGDCQLVFLPVKCDQFFNSKLFGLDLNVGIEVKRRDEDGYFDKFDVLEAVKTVMVKVDREPSKSIRTNQRKWREFVMNKEIQDKYICDLVRDLKALAWKDD